MKMFKKKYLLTNEGALPVGDDKGTQNSKYYLVFAKSYSSLKFQEWHVQKIV